MFLQDKEETRGADTLYPLKEDIPLTPTEWKEIERRKGELLSELAKNKAVTDIFESLALKTSIYAVSRMLLLSGGQIGIYFCFVSLFASFMTDNRDFFKAEDIHYDEGLKLNAMNKLFKVVFSLIGCGVFAYSTVGDYMTLVKTSDQAYHFLTQKIEQFHSPASRENQQLLAVAVGAGVTFLVLMGSQFKPR